MNPAEANSNSPHLHRRIGLRSAVALNILEMVGVGPFITLPLVIAAAGYRLSLWAWLVGAAIALADGLVWAELGAAFPRAGGSYAFLREIYHPQGAGNWLSFLYVWQISFTAPLSIASGCIGLSGFLSVFWPQLDKPVLASLPWLHGSSLAAATACLLVTWLLYRRLSVVTGLAWILFIGVLAALSGVIVSGFVHAHTLGSFTLPAAPPLTAALAGLAQATLITTYDYWGYYNICFLGAEVRQPEKTIPRAILLSVTLVAGFYLLMNLAALPSLRDAAGHFAARAADNAALRMPLVADIATSAFGRWAGYLLATLIVWTAFASIFSLLLGYSRVPYAAARDGNYFRIFATLHPRHEIPHRSLIALGVVGCLFCFLPLQEVISLLVITRVFLQYMLQQGGVIYLRWSRPKLERPFRMPLFPLPPLVAMAGFLFILSHRAHALRGVIVAACIAISGTLLYMLRAKKLRLWPFAQ